MSLWQTLEQIGKSRDRLLDADPDDEADDDAAEGIEKRLDDLEQRATDLSTSIALLGDTNAGKSTLINALMGGSVLPKSGVGVGTASMTSLSTARRHVRRRGSSPRAANSHSNARSCSTTEDRHRRQRQRHIVRQMPLRSVDGLSDLRHVAHLPATGQLARCAGTRRRAALAEGR